MIQVVRSLAEYWEHARPELQISVLLPRDLLPYAKEEDTSDISKCTFADLPYQMVDDQIIRKYLGGEEEAKKKAFTLNQIRTYLDNQLGPEGGPLHADGKYSIFFVAGKGEKLVSVRICLMRSRWCVHHYHPDEPSLWSTTGRVFLNNL